MNRIIDMTTGQTAVGIAFGLVALGWTIAVSIAPHTLSLSGSEPVSCRQYRGQFQVDLNTTPADSLELIPGLSSTRVQAIMDARCHQPFTSLDELLRLPGFGPNSVASVAPFVRAPL